MTLPLELGGIQDPQVRRAFEQIAQRFPLQQQDFANVLLLLAAIGTSRKVAFGTATLAFAAAITSNIVAVTHGLGVTPQVVVATSVNNGFGSIVVPGTNGLGATTFNIFGEIRIAMTGNATVGWVAIG